MTREEDIKARLDAYDCKYLNALTDEFVQWADDDIRHLLDSNEKLQQRVKKLERLHKAMKNCRYYGWDEADAKPINDALAELEEKEST